MNELEVVNSTRMREKINESPTRMNFYIYLVVLWRDESQRN